MANKIPFSDFPINKDLSPLDSQVFESPIEQEVLVSILESLDHVRVEYVSREEFNVLKGDFITESGEDKFGKIYTLKLPQDFFNGLRKGEIFSIIRRVNRVTFGDVLPDYASVNELKYKLGRVYNFLSGQLKRTDLSDIDRANLKNAVNKYILLSDELFSEASGREEKYDYSFLDFQRVNDKRFINHYKTFDTKFNKLKVSMGITGLLSEVEELIAGEAVNHFKEVFFESGVNLVRFGLRTFTLANLEATKEKNKKKEKGEKIKTSSINVKSLKEQEEMLRGVLKIEEYKKKLEDVRKFPLSTIELQKEAANHILSTLHTMYPYQLTEENDGYQPNKILRSKELYCVGFSIVGHTFLSELGIKHNALMIPGHSALEVIIGSDSYYFDGTLGKKMGVMKRGKNTGVYKDFSVFEGNNKIYSNKALSGNAEKILLAQIYNNKGASLYEKGDAHLASGMYREAIRLIPNYAGSHYNLGLLLDGEEAIKEFDKAISLLPGEVDYYNGRAVEHSDRKRYDEAKKDFIAGLNLESDLKYAYKNFGKLLLREGKTKFVPLFYMVEKSVDEDFIIPKIEGASESNIEAYEKHIESLLEGKNYDDVRDYLLKLIENEG